MCNNELINFNNKLYHIYRKIKIDSIKEENINKAKDFYNCDLALKHQDANLYLFLREISDVQYDMIP